jgi:hypothetical protein
LHLHKNSKRAKFAVVLLKLLVTNCYFIDLKQD